MDSDSEYFSEVEEMMDAPGPSSSTAGCSQGERRPDFLQVKKDGENAALKPAEGSAQDVGPEVNVNAIPPNANEGQQVDFQAAIQAPIARVEDRREDFTYGFKFTKSQGPAFSFWAGKMRKTLLKMNPSLGGKILKRMIHDIWNDLPMAEKTLWKELVIERNDRNDPVVNPVPSRLRFIPMSNKVSAKSPPSNSPFEKAKVYVPFGTVPIVNTIGGVFVVKEIGENPKTYRLVRIAKHTYHADPAVKNDGSRGVIGD